MKTEIEIYEDFCNETENMRNLFKKKNHDYGNSYFEDDHTSDDAFANVKRKYARLKNFYENDKNLCISETIEDTLRDLSIYCAMEIVRLKNGK